MGYLQKKLFTSKINLIWIHRYYFVNLIQFIVSNWNLLSSTFGIKRILIESFLHAFLSIKFLILLWQLAHRSTFLKTLCFLQWRESWWLIYCCCHTHWKVSISMRFIWVRSFHRQQITLCFNKVARRGAIYDW